MQRMKVLFSVVLAVGQAQILKPSLPATYEVFLEKNVNDQTTYQRKSTLRFFLCQNDYGNR